MRHGRLRRRTDQRDDDADGDLPTLRWREAPERQLGPEGPSITPDRPSAVSSGEQVLGDALFEHGGDIWGEDVGVAGSCWKAPAIGGGLG